MSTHEYSSAHFGDRMFDLTLPNNGRTLQDFDDSEIPADLRPFMIPEPRVTQVYPVETDYSPEQQKLINLLFRSGCMQFGDFRLTSGKESFYKLDLAHSQHDPSLSSMIVAEYIHTIQAQNIMPDILSPVPSASTPTLSVVARDLGLPMITVRIKETDPEGDFVVDGFTQGSVGQEALVGDDAGTTGGSIKKAAEALRRRGVVVKNAVVLLDREEEASDNLATIGIKLVSSFKSGKMFQYALEARTTLGKPILTDEARELIKANLNNFPSIRE